MWKTKCDCSIAVGLHNLSTPSAYKSDKAKHRKSRCRLLWLNATCHPRPPTFKCIRQLLSINLQNKWIVPYMTLKQKWDSNTPAQSPQSWAAPTGSERWARCLLALWDVFGTNNWAINHVSTTVGSIQELVGTLWKKATVHCSNRLNIGEKKNTKKIKSQAYHSVTWI